MSNFIVDPKTLCAICSGPSTFRCPICPIKYCEKCSHTNHTQGLSLHRIICEPYEDLVATPRPSKDHCIALLLTRQVGFVYIRTIEGGAGADITEIHKVMELEADDEIDVVDVCKIPAKIVEDDTGYWRINRDLSMKKPIKCWFKKVSDQDAARGGHGLYGTGQGIAPTGVRWMNPLLILVGEESSRVGEVPGFKFEDVVMGDMQPIGEFLKAPEWIVRGDGYYVVDGEIRYS